MTSRYIRIVSILIVFLAILGVILAIANMQTPTLAQAPTSVPLPEKATADNCAACHAEVHAMWHQGGHGDTRGQAAMGQRNNCLACHKEVPQSSMPDPSGSTPNFNDYWIDQGKPNNCMQCHVTGYDAATDTWKADGITCEACHSPIPANHPNDNMPVDKNTDLCRTCHTDARFGWDTWNQSAHSKNNITCTNCHNPHSTSLKPTDKSAVDMSSLCENCHKEMTQNPNQTHSQHVESGATCVMCHIGDSKGDDAFHKVPDHDFKPKIESCNGCHADQMHTDGSPVSLPVFERAPAKADPTAKPLSVISVAPKHVSPFGYAGLATALGIIGGVIWRKLARRRTQNKTDVK